MFPAMKSSQLVFARAVALLCGLAMAVLAQSEYDMQNAMGYEFGLATQLCGCRHRGTGCDASKAFSTASHGRVCSAEESVYAVKLNAVVADGCPNAGKVIPGVQVHVWQSNADGTYECADKCNTHLTTGENGQVRQGPMMISCSTVEMRKVHLRLFLRCICSRLYT